ncbi:methyl-accepting chemotaxis protein [Trichlorobacter ammonificans]|uniref:Methyl-accepting chemotaxis sensory transducer with GAF sensor n=1 Tax=Trichlorobacter ammonificans TaxID=2916410 RepID=A0ABN8HL61_9BACT|nr:methyl-accepting chemotaxis protein [Trichlorobacter ammonificans]CAH2032085.1 Methyl-accepting chemotaxis sensory transducer with GAF sensor [Trichlorobacter ammonificans]
MSRAVSHSRSYSILGVLMGLGAPVGWILIRLIFYAEPDQPLLDQVFFDVFKDAKHLTLYLYMGLGTSVVLGITGFLIGTNGDELLSRARQLDELHREVAAQKELFENRFLVLDTNIKNFHHISSRIQTSLNLEEVLMLCAEGLHDVLGYERVNILMLAQNGRKLRFVTASGSDAEATQGVTLPVDQSIGVIYKSISEAKPYLIDDITRYGSDYHLQPPHDRIEALRSRNFIICPMVVKGAAVGAFAIDNKRSRRPLNESDLDTIMLFADQVSNAITRINLLTSIDTLTSELESSFSFLLSHRAQYSRNEIALGESIESVADGAAVIASAAEGAMASVDETSTAVNEISVAIEEVSRNLDTLAGIVHQAASAMEEIASTITSVERSAAMSHEVSSQVQNQTGEGRRAVNDTIGFLADIQHSVEESYAGITRLAEKSGRIENIVSVINDITKRTNLLALNASIIAAQAGEYGRSFGVVADEIRNLSLQTGHSTGEITGIIDEIMFESRQAADRITSTKGLVSRGVELGHAMGETLQSIYDRSVCSMEMTQEIKQATEEQSTSVQLVARSMEDISSMTSQIFNASKDQAKATRSIARAIETIKEMAHEMVRSTSSQVDDTQRIRRTVESVNAMVAEMFDNMEARRAQGAEVIKELESMKSTTCQL